MSHPMRERLAFALDFATLDEARAAARELAPWVGVLKVGLELFVREGRAAAEIGRDLDDVAIFLDLKLHDIPETVERAVASARSYGVRYLTVHASGGRAMLARAIAAATADGPHPPLQILAVTVLTSLDASDLAAIGVPEDSRTQVLRLAKLAWSAGVRGFVSSAEEAAALRAALPEAFIVTPGIRLADTGSNAGAAQDQKRVATPARAIADGADLLVVGRPIRDARDRVLATKSILEDMGAR